MEAVVFQSAGGELLKVGCSTRSAKGARRREAHIVEQDDQYVGCAFGWAQRLDRRKLCIRVFGVIGSEGGVRLG